MVGQGSDTTKVGIEHNEKSIWFGDFRELGFPWTEVPDLDQHWRDGRLLLALVHRFAPALVNREEIMAGEETPDKDKERTKKAIQLARLHLGIR